jgi:asparagine synthetase B (glutamine-hydrolysing)
MDSQLFDILCDTLLDNVAETDVAVLLGGGIDGAATAAAAVAVGHVATAYTFTLAGQKSKDLQAAQAIAQHLGIPHKTIEIQTENVADDFIRLAGDFGCNRKRQYECSYPLMHAFPQITERVVLTGFNADDHFGNTRKANVKQAAMRKAGVSAATRKRVFDADRNALFDELAMDPASQDTWAFAKCVAADAGKILIDPYLSDAVRQFFLDYSHEELYSPRKPLIRAQVAPFIGGLFGHIITGVRYQKGAGVHKLFETLLDDPRINRFDVHYRSVSQLCQRWGREIAAGYVP